MVFAGDCVETTVYRDATRLYTLCTRESIHTYGEYPVDGRKKNSTAVVGNMPGHPIHGPPGFQMIGSAMYPGQAHCAGALQAALCSHGSRG